MKFSNKIILLINGIFLLVISTHSIVRDFHLEKQYTVDLRNRVVGARLEKDGRLPYNYYFRPADGLRYFDFQNQNIDSSGASNATASPFFHQLLYPICDLPQGTISKIWLYIQYIFLACMIFMISTLTDNTREKLLILNLGILFTTTEAWKNLIKCGQLYLFVAFLIGCVITGLLSHKRSGIVLAGVCAVVFILTRPVGIVFLIPLTIFYRKYILFLTVAFSGLVIYLIFVLSSPYEKSLYENYVSRMKMHVQYHQLVLTNPRGIPNTNTFFLKKFEGIDFENVDRQINDHPIKIYSENGNIFLLYYYLTHKKMSLAWLFFLTASVILILSLSFYFTSRKYPIQQMQILLFGFTLYMVVDLFSPVTRHQYNTVQWFPLVLGGFLILPGWINKISLLLLAGLVLNIVNFSWLPMRHTLGEFCWMAAMILLAFSPRLKQLA